MLASFFTVRMIDKVAMNSAANAATAELHNRRFRRGSRRYVRRYVLASLAVLAIFICCAVYYVTRPTTLRVAIDSHGQQDAQRLNSFAKSLENDHASLRLTIAPTADPDQTPAKLGDREATLVVARSDSELPSNARAVVSLRKIAIILIDVRRTPTDTPSGLNGRRIAFSSNDPRDQSFVELVLKRSGVDQPSLVTLTSDQLVAAIKSKQIDAVVLTGVLTDPRIQVIVDQVASAGDAKFLSLDNADAIALSFPQYESVEIPEGLFGSKPTRPSEKIDTVVVSDILVADKDVSATTIADLTRRLLSDSGWRKYPGGRLEAVSTDKDAPLLAHEGTIAFLDGTERTFIERYSDIFWFALVLASGLGTIGVGLRSFIKLDERRANNRLRKRLVQITGSIGKTETAKELEDMRSEADSILDHTLLCYEEGAIEDGSLSAFGLLAMRFYSKVSDRILEIEASQAISRR